MKKRPSTSAVHDQIIPKYQSRKCNSVKPAPFATRSNPTLLGKHRSVSYLPGEKTRKEPLELSRLFIQGFGGSIKMDLQGVGVRLSNAVFAHMVADDSLEAAHVRRGDIALIEPIFRRLHDGNLILLDLDSRPSLRRLRKVRSNWMLDPVDQKSSESVLLSDQSIQGVVIGFVRLFGELKPVRYEGTEANYCTGFEKPARPSKLKRGPLRYSRSNSHLDEFETTDNPHRYLASKGKRDFMLNDFNEKAGYKA